MDRPDIALVVKASFNNTSRRITFPSAAKCRLNALFARITESFSLGASSFHIAYTDEDGEDFDIVSEADLTEAVSYFSSGLDADDYGTSLGAPTLYSADWNNAAHDHTSLPVFQPSTRNKIILRVHVVVEYDGPSLSDTASIMESVSGSSAGASWAQEESSSSSENAYTNQTSDYSGIESGRHGQREFRSASTNLRESSRTNGSSAEQFRGNDPHSRTLPTGSSRPNQDSRSFESSESDIYRRSSASMGFSDTRRRHGDPFNESNLRRRTSSRIEDGRVDNALRSLSLNSRPDQYHLNGEQEWNSRPSSHQASLTSLPDLRDSTLSLDRSLASSTPSASVQRRNNGAPSSSLTSSELGARWIREQTERVRRKLGPVSSPGGSSRRSSLASEEGSDDDQISIYSEGRGNLELVRETNGKWYYSYSSTDMPGQRSTRGDIPLSERRSMASLEDSAYADNASRRDAQDITSLRLSMTSINTDPFRGERRREDYASSSEVSPIETESLQTPAEVAEEFEEPVGPPGLAPDCSACGVRLEYMRYVCTVCGEGHFWLESDEARQSVCLSAGEDQDSEDSSSSASSGDQTTWAPPRRLSNGTNDLGETSRQPKDRRRNSVESAETSLTPEAPLHRKYARNGYELCPACIELRGIQHTKAMGEIEMNRQGTNGPIQNIRKFGTLNHTYKELLWGAKGWKEIEYNDKCKCSICQIELFHNRFKCISCSTFDLCRTCHQNAQEIHPAHPFLAVPDQKPGARPPPASSSSPIHLPDMPTPVQYPGMHAVKHAGVFCHNCMQDIIGPRFHCAVCPNWDVCVQCEPVTSAQTGTGSHTSDHIMMKIPLPLASSEVQQVSRRAREQWAQRDYTVVLAAGDILDEGISERPVSPTNETAYGGPAFRRSPLDHGTRCRSCSRSIIGKRYQCANCPSEPEPYNLCSACERTSYTTHDPMHVFVKFDRPAHFPLQSTLPILPVLYKTPVGQVRSTMPLDPRDPTAYLRCVEHRSTICDVHVGPIQGVWLRCVHCAGSFDVCLACEGTSDHDPTHIFAVFKSEVDMPKFRALAALSSEHSRPLILQRCYVT